MDHVDALIERRRLSKKMRFWRMSFFAVILVIIVLVGLGLSAKDSTAFMSPSIARLHVDGIIMDDPDFLKKISKLADNENVKAVIVDINSPGGTTVGAEGLYEELRLLAQKKPVTAVMREYAASGGYITAIASDYVVARGNTLTGSIGVILSAPNFTEIMKTVGISMDTFKSAPAKGEPTGTAPISPEGRQNLDMMVGDSYQWFYNLVKERRNIPDDKLKTIASGQVYTGRIAKSLSLIDALGDERVAIKWLEDEKKIKKDLPIVDVRPAEETEKWIEKLAGQVISSVFYKIHGKISLSSMVTVD